MERHWIIMADIRGSSELPGAEVIRVFRKVVDDVNEKFSRDILSPLSITLGDEFQGIVKSLDVIRELIFYMDEVLLMQHPFFMLRIVANYGLIETPLNRDTAYGMLGEGLSETRNRLNTLKKAEEDIQISGNDTEEKDRMQTLAFRWYRSIYGGWPSKDRNIAADFIREGDYKTVARLHDRDTSSMWRKGETLQMKDFLASKELITLLTKEI